MKKHLVKTMLWALLAFSLASTGCSVVSKFAGGGQDDARDAAVAPYTADSLHNYKAARDFAAQGRYELAREHYLLALAAATDPYLQDALAVELESVDLMIRSLR